MPNPTVDLGMIDAFDNYVKYGLDPGGYGTFLLAHNLDGAIVRAHHLFMKWETFPGEVSHNHLAYIKQFVPSVAQGSMEAVKNWIDHKGLQNAPEEILSFVMLEGKDRMYKDFSNF